MPEFEHGATSIYYEEHGEGYPLLLFAPGGMNSTVERWAAATLNALVEFRDDFRLIAMDQRNAGRSAGPLEVDDPWGSFARDQLALLDHLGVEDCHVMGCCIGCSFALKLSELAPERFSAAVLEQPVGVVGQNRHLYESLWRNWGEELVAARPDIDAAQLERFGTRMWDGEFVVSVDREFVSSCSTPLLVLPGIDDYHPSETGREVARLAPTAEAFEPWKDTPEHTAQAAEAVREFLRGHTPGQSRATG
jgi:pimeloyl-ACP methyl ester carboxylesterase